MRFYFNVLLINVLLGSIDMNDEKSKKLYTFLSQIFGIGIIMLYLWG